jgi:hypothetical protein
MTEPIKHQHLAELLEEEMAERGWTITDLVMNMGPHFSAEDWGICQLSWDLFFAVREPYVILGNEWEDAGLCGGQLMAFHSEVTL